MCRCICMSQRRVVWTPCAIGRNGLASACIGGYTTLPYTSFVYSVAYDQSTHRTVQHTTLDTAHSRHVPRHRIRIAHTVTLRVRVVA